MRRRAWISAIAVIVVSVSLFFTLYVHTSPSSPQESNVTPDIPEPEVASIGQYYLTKPPYFPNYTTEITKIFLENATLQPNKYSNISFTADSGEDKFEGVPAVLVNATVRNDYSLSEIIQFAEEGTSRADIWLDVYLYDEEGDIVDVIQQGNVFKGSVQLVLFSGEVATVNLVFITDRKITRFEIYVSYPRDVLVSESN